jgi:hypothetical protein
MSLASPGRLISLAVRETLESAVAPHRVEELLQQALSNADLPEVPDDPLKFEIFLKASLRPVLVSELGEELGESLFIELARLANSAISTMPPDPASVSRLRATHKSSSPPDSADYARGTASALEAPAGTAAQSGAARVATILICSTDGAFAERMQAFVDDRSRTQQIPNLIALLQALDKANAAESAIILDCRRPSIRPQSLATLAAELPENVKVVLWACDNRLLAELSELSPKVRAWLVCVKDAHEREVIRYCIKLVS